MEWVRTQWAAAEAEANRLQTELDEALKTLAKWEAKFAHVRKLLDSEKRERNIVMKKYKELVSSWAANCVLSLNIHTYSEIFILTEGYDIDF